MTHQVAVVYEYSGPARNVTYMVTLFVLAGSAPREVVDMVGPGRDARDVGLIIEPGSLEDVELMQAYDKNTQCMGALAFSSYEKGLDYFFLRRISRATIIAILIASRCIACALFFFGWRSRWISRISRIFDQRS